MSGISTHVLDTSRGRPAAGLMIALEREDPGGGWETLARVPTDAGGRVARLLPAGYQLFSGIYRVTFDTEAYFRECGTEGFYPAVTILVNIANSSEHYHIPLLLSPFGYSTYRGS